MNARRGTQGFGRALARFAMLSTTLALVIGIPFGVVIGTATPAMGARWMTIIGNERATYDPAAGGPIFMLAVGNDERKGVSGRRADAIHLIGINPASKTATILNYPRDSVVPIAGRGRDKINAANTYGLRTTIDTVANLSGVAIPFAAQVNFDQFIAAIDAMGGIDIYVDTPMSDKNSGAFFDVGMQRFNGDAALRYSRNRYDFPDSDITRTANQAKLLIAALSTLKASAPGPAGTIRLLGLASRHLELEGTTIPEVYPIARAAMSVDPATIKQVTIPLSGAPASLYEDFRDDAILQNH